ncbi:MAG: hypothetical protein GF308_05025 [Candidatus Heimdallarchaeota archaeon]|nr:hypothetical protein [Candidatus Heimdallarchaeota archaeon]
MSLTEQVKRKVFTLRKPRYTKITSPRIEQAEKDINQHLNRQDIESTADPQNIGDFLVLFIHGFGASKFCWTDPDIGNLGWVKDYRHDPKPIDHGWHAIPPIPFIPVDMTLSKQLVPRGVTELFDKHQIEWLIYSQKSAFGDINDSISELKQLMKGIKAIYDHRRIIVIAHSRGGLITKKYLDSTPKIPVEKLVTFGTPYYGTFFGYLEMFQMPSKTFLNRVKGIKRLWDVTQERQVESISTKQMKPKSDFLKQLNEKGCRKGVEYVSVAGTSSRFTNVYIWHWHPSSWNRQVSKAKEKHKLREELKTKGAPTNLWWNLPTNPHIQAFNWLLKPTKILTIYPRLGYKEVLQGDGAVSVENALLNEPEVKYYVTNDNHIELTCSKQSKEIMLREVKLHGKQ